MTEQIILCLVYAINALENLPEDAKADGLIKFCNDNGLPDHRLTELLDMPGDTDAGKVIRALEADGLEQARQDAEADTEESQTEGTDDATPPEQSAPPAEPEPPVEPQPPIEPPPAAPLVGGTHDGVDEEPPAHNGQ